MAERSVGIVKTNLRKFLHSKTKSGLKNELLDFLFKYRNTPLSHGDCPSERVLKYCVRTNLSILSKQVQSSYSRPVPRLEESGRKEVKMSSILTPKMNFRGVGKGKEFELKTNSVIIKFRTKNKYRGTSIMYFVVEYIKNGQNFCKRWRI